MERCCFERLWEGRRFVGTILASASADGKEKRNGYNYLPKKQIINRYNNTTTHLNG